MKIKPLYVYPILGVIVVVFLVIGALLGPSKQNISGKNIPGVETPKNNVHGRMQEMDSEAPANSNVSPEFNKRLKELKAVVDKNPKDTLKIREYADFIAAAHKTAEAVFYYDKILKANPKRTDIRLNIALLYYMNRDFANAEDCLTSILEYDKNNPVAVFNLGIIAATKGENEKAKKIWNGLISKNINRHITDEAKKAVAGLE